jgi:fructose-1,6-bisphosphatase/inositol monophosphatase family enzyme
MSQAPSSLLQELGAIVKAASANELLPRFRRLGDGDVMSKASKEDPTDLVTVADRAAESFLDERLRALVPGSVVVGEEAVAADATVLDRLNGSAPVWIVDPLDGTRYFAAGTGPFGPMVALAEKGTLQAAAIHLPLTDALFLAERGQGAFRNGERLASNVASASQAPGAPPKGTLFSKFMPPELSVELARRHAKHVVDAAPVCAANEYTNLAQGLKDYSVYFRLMPWDHAPGVLILREAGGVARHPDGREYEVHARREPLLVARSPEMWSRVRADLFGGT